MFASDASSLSTPPAPAVKNPPIKLQYEEVCYAAHSNALTDFVRQRKYWQLRRDLKRTGKDVHVMPVPEAMADSLVRKSGSRMLKEHSSASWGAFFYQTSLFSMIGVCSIGTAMLTYFGIYHNRFVLPFAPLSAAMTWRMWSSIEEAWEQQRYLDNAAQIRSERKGNPMNAIVKRRKKDVAATAAARETEVDNATDMS